MAMNGAVDGKSTLARPTGDSQSTEPDVVMPMSLVQRMSRGRGRKMSRGRAEVKGTGQAETVVAAVAAVAAVVVAKRETMTETMAKMNMTRRKVRTMKRGTKKI